MPIFVGPNMTAQDNASIQYPMESTPYFAVRRGSQWFPDEYVVKLSDNLPENFICTPRFGVAPKAESRNEGSADEVLDWDFVADREPLRNARTIKVKLRFLGHDPVIRFEGYLN